MTIQAPPFGRDVSATSQVHHGIVVSGTRLVAEAAYRRLITERGSLEDDPNYGLPLRKWIGSITTEGDRLARADQIRGELLKDPRLDQIRVHIGVVRSGPLQNWIVTIEGITLDGGEFDLAVEASAVTYAMLRIETR